MLADLTNAEQMVLVDVLVASVRQASEGPALAGRSGAKKVCSVPVKPNPFSEMGNDAPDDVTRVLAVAGDERQGKENAD